MGKVEKQALEAWLDNHLDCPFPMPDDEKAAKQELEILESEVARLHSTESLLKQKLPGLGALRKRYSK